MSKKTPGVIIPADMHKPPEAHEIKAAWILAHYFDTAVEFIKPADTYKNKTPDFMMNDIAWEVKCPREVEHCYPETNWPGNETIEIYCY
jgi:hypothetical protein